MALARVLVAACVALLATACTDGDERTPAAQDGGTSADPAPPGAVVLVDGVPITRDEVERWAAWIAAVEPQYVPDARRRFALTNGLLERAALRAARGDERRAAEARARAAASQLALEPSVAPEGATRQTVEGSWHTLGIQLWGELQPTRPGVWIGPIERLGTFTLARVTSSRHEHGIEVLVVELVDYPFLEPESARRDLARAVDDARLTIVDPDYEAIVPEAWKYRMDGPER
ncbi:MAG: hypothetical protein WD226_11595 [Planctomycetota bacterium]